MEQTNILGTMPLSRLVLHMSWPIMLSMLMQAVYNLVDSVFVAQISDQAFLALSYAYPIQTLMIAFCSGFGVAFSAMLSKRLGEGDLPGANSCVFHGLLFFLGNWVLFLLFGLLAAPAYLRGCTGTAAVVGMGTDYLRDAVCIGFAANEALSILENAGLMGIPFPKKLKKAIDVLKTRSEISADRK